MDQSVYKLSRKVLLIEAAISTIVCLIYFLGKNFLFFRVVIFSLGLVFFSKMLITYKSKSRYFQIDWARKKTFFLDSNHKIIPNRPSIDLSQFTTISVIGAGSFIIRYTLSLGDRKGQEITLHEFMDFVQAKEINDLFVQKLGYKSFADQNGLFKN